MPRSLRVSATITVVPALAAGGMASRVARSRSFQETASASTSHSARTMGGGEVARYSRRRSSARRSSSTTRCTGRGAAELLVGLRRGPRASVAPGPGAGCGVGELAAFPGSPGQFAEDGQGQGAVPGEQQLPGCGAEDLLEQGGGGRFVGAECVLEPAAGAADAPAAPVIRVARVIDAGDQMRLPVGVRAGNAAGRPGRRPGRLRCPSRRPAARTGAVAHSHGCRR